MALFLCFLRLSIFGVSGSVGALAGHKPCRKGLTADARRGDAAAAVTLAASCSFLYHRCFLSEDAVSSS